MSSNYSTADSPSEGEIQLLASLARAVADDLSTDRISLEDASDRFGPFRADQTGAVDKLRDKGLITGNDDALSLTEEEFIPAFDNGLMARYLFHVRV